MIVEEGNPTPVKEAIQRIINQRGPIPAITIVFEKSLNRALVEDTVATYDIPRFDRSPHDSFTIRSAGSQGASGQDRIEFKVIDHIGVDSVSDRLVGDHEAVCIMTGAQIPSGADAVAMFKQMVEPEDTFTIRKPFSKNEDISLEGGEIKTDDVVLKKGQVINPGAVAVLATYGYAEVKVIRQPSAAVITTGGKLLDANDILGDGKVRSSSGPMICALVEKLDLEVGIYKTQRDDLDNGIQVVKEAMEKHNITITTGGVPVGDFDYLLEIYKAVEVEVLLNRVAMRPGSVTAVASTDGEYLFGLPGNPPACFTGLELFVKPAVKHICDALEVFPQIIKTALMEDFTKANLFARFIRARATLASAGATVVPSGSNKSDAVIAIIHANYMVMLPGGSRGFKMGHTVDITLTGSNIAEEEFLL